MYRARARYRDYDGRTRAVEARGKTKAQAKLNLREKLAHRATPVGGQITKDSKFSDLADLYFAEAHLGKASDYQYRNHWEKRIKPAMGELRLREVTAGRCVAFLATMADRPSMAAVVRVVLCNILATGTRLDLFVTNPAKATVVPEITRKPPEALTLDEVRELRRLVAAYDAKQPGCPMLLDALDVMLGTGLRVSEVAPLRWQDIDLETRVITIEHHVTYARGGAILAPSTKSNAQARELTVPRFVTTALRARRQRVDGDWVFPSARTGTHVAPGTISDRLAKARGSDFAEVTPHTIRRTVATLIEAERDADAASLQLGHSSTRTTERHYIAAKPLVAPDLSDILERAVSSEF